MASSITSLSVIFCFRISFGQILFSLVMKCQESHTFKFRYLNKVALPWKKLVIPLMSVEVLACVS